MKAQYQPQDFQISNDREWITTTFSLSSYSPISSPIFPQPKLSLGLCCPRASPALGFRFSLLFLYLSSFYLSISRLSFRLVTTDSFFSRWFRGFRSMFFLGVLILNLCLFESRNRRSWESVTQLWARNTRRPSTRPRRSSEASSPRRTALLSFSDLRMSL